MGHHLRRIADDGFGMSDANVACRQLGMGPTASFGTVGGGNGTIHFSDMACNGTERRLSTCGRLPLPQQSYSSYCWHSQDVGVTCANDPSLFKL